MLIALLSVPGGALISQMVAAQVPALQALPGVSVAFSPVGVGLLLCVVSIGPLAASVHAQRGLAPALSYFGVVVVGLCAAIYQVLLASARENVAGHYTASANTLLLGLVGVVGVYAFGLALRKRLTRGDPQPGI